jgi:hypothetical protein
VLELSTVIITGIGLVAFFFGLEFIFAGLIISSVLQAMAFINLGDNPITVYYFFALLFIVRGFIDLYLDRGAILWTSGQNAPLIYLSLFVFYSVFGAFVLPNVFSGMLVYSPKLGIDEQVNNMTRLAFESTNINQAAQLLANAFIIGIIWVKPMTPPLFIRAVLIAWGTVIFFALWQWLANMTDIYFPEAYLYTVEGWSLGNDQLIGSFARVNGSFVEPSSLATYLCGMYGFFLIWWIRNPHWRLLLCLLLTIIVMFITTSSTAYLGFFLILGAVLWGLGFVPFFTSGSIYKSVGMIFLALLIGIFLVLMLWLGSDQIRELINVVLLQKSDGDSFVVRFNADLQSVQILWSTYGLGVGLGSNRPSSFLLFLLSNVGILGSLFFTLFIISLAHLALRNTAQSDQAVLHNWAIAAVWGLCSLLLAKMIAQPDLSFSSLWIWIFLLASMATIQTQSDSISFPHKI